MGAYMASHCTYTLSLAAPVESLSPPSAEKNLPLLHDPLPRLKHIEFEVAMPSLASNNSS